MVWVRPDPCSGRSDATMNGGVPPPPPSIGLHDDAGSAVAPPVVVVAVVVVPPPPGFFLPQPVATSARQPTAPMSAPNTSRFLTLPPSVRCPCRSAAPTDRAATRAVLVLEARISTDKRTAPPLQECRRWDSNPHGAYAPRDFESRVPTSYTTPALGHDRRNDAGRNAHGRWGLPRPERRHPGGGAPILRPRLRRRGRARGLARARGGPVRTARAARDLGDPPARRHDHRDLADEPLPGRRRGRARARELRARGPRRASTRSTSFRSWASPRRSTTISPPPTTPSASTLRSSSRPRRSTACTRRPSRTTASWSSR